MQPFTATFIQVLHKM